MSTHNICFYGEKSKIIPGLSFNTPNKQVLWYLFVPLAATQCTYKYTPIRIKNLYIKQWPIIKPVHEEQILTTCK